MTTQQPFECQPTSPKRAETIDRFDGILGTGGAETTTRGEQGGNQESIATDQPDQYEFHCSPQWHKVVIGRIQKLSSCLTHFLLLNFYSLSV